MDRGSSKVGPRQDEALKHDTEGLVRGGHSTHAEEWKGSEPPSEDQPDPDRMADPRLPGTAPDGMTEADVAQRSELATYIGRGYPLSAAELLDRATENNAPDHVIGKLRSLDGGSYESLQEVWTALGGGTEEHRN